MKTGVSVVIPARNESSHIGRCIEGIRAQESGEAEISDIVVVDNGSTDGTAEIAESLGVRVIGQATGTVGSLRNRGARETEGDVIAFLDGDCVPGTGWLSAAVSTLRDGGAQAAGSFHQIPEDCGWIGHAYGMIQEGRKEGNANYIPSGNMIISREAFEAVGGFDESLRTNEDVDLCRRLVRNGYGICVNPDIRCMHLGSPQGIGEMIRREVWHGSHTWKVFWKDFKGVRNLGIVTFSLANLSLLLLWTGSMVYWMLGGSWAPALVFTLAFIGLSAFVAFRDWKRVRRGYLSILCYVMLYGISRAVGVFGWVRR